MLASSLLALLSLAALSPSAQAAVYGGNPELTLTVQRPQDDLTEGFVTLDKVVLKHCAGGANIWNTDVDIDPVAGFSMDIPAGEFCSVEFHWDTVMELDGSCSQGSFSLEHDASVTTVTLTGTSQSVELDPIDWISGIVHGGNPEAVVTIQ